MENNSEIVVKKVWRKFSDIKRLRDSLPGGSIQRISTELSRTPQSVTIEFNNVTTSQISEDRDSRLISLHVLQVAVKVMQETGNTSFDFMIEPDGN